MPAYKISPVASRDIMQIFDPISEESETSACRVVSKIYDGFLLLANNPNIGSRCDELLENARRLSLGSYVIYFRSLESPHFVVEILRVVHGARDASDFL